MHQIEAHFHMINDRVRILEYSSAIKRHFDKEVHRHQNAVEIGAGTGILSIELAKHCLQDVFSIEYYEHSHLFAKKVFEWNNKGNITAILDSSYKVDLSTKAPGLLVTETIGNIGPEERIVELCYDFCKRHPSIHTIIPTCLRIYLQPIYSKKIETDYLAMRSAYFENLLPSNANETEFILLFDRYYCSKIINSKINDVSNSGQAILIKNWLLGNDWDSSFESSMDLNCDYNGILIYFEAEMNGESILSNHISKPLTHWQHNYLKIPKYHRSNLVFGYNPKINDFHIGWT